MIEGPQHYERRSTGATRRSGMKAAKAFHFIVAAFSSQAAYVAAEATDAQLTDHHSLKESTRVETTKKLGGDAVQAMGSSNGDQTNLKAKATNKIENKTAIDKQMLEDVEDGISPRFSLVSSDKEVTSGESLCETVTYNSNRFQDKVDEWNDSNRAQPSDNSGYACKGIGFCHDDYGIRYDSVLFTDILSQEKCADKCSSIPTNKSSFRGFSYTCYGFCWCYYEDGKVPVDLDSTLTITNQDGTGEITKADGYGGAVCFAYEKWCKCAHPCQGPGGGLNKIECMSGAGIDVRYCASESFCSNSEVVSYDTDEPGGAVWSSLCGGSCDSSDMAETKDELSFLHGKTKGVE